jgi:hypothetical protein
VISAASASNLRRWNIALAILHAAQGVAVLLLSNGFTLGVTIPYMEGPPGSPVLGTEPVWQVPLATFIAVFLFLAAADHLLCALPASTAGTSPTSAAEPIRCGGGSTRSARR